MIEIHVDVDVTMADGQQLVDHLSLRSARKPTSHEIAEHLAPIVAEHRGGVRAVAHVVAAVEIGQKVMP